MGNIRPSGGSNLVIAFIINSILYGGASGELTFPGNHDCNNTNEPPHQNRNQQEIHRSPKTLSHQEYGPSQMPAPLRFAGCSGYQFNGRAAGANPSSTAQAAQTPPSPPPGGTLQRQERVKSIHAPSFRKSIGPRHCPRVRQTDAAPPLHGKFPAVRRSYGILERFFGERVKIPLGGDPRCKKRGLAPGFSPLRPFPQKTLL